MKKDPFAEAIRHFKEYVDPDKVIVPNLEGRGVLIIEDDPTERFRAEKAVLKMGYLPFAVDNGKRASSALDQATFLFVLTDLHYPCCSRNNTTISEQKLPQPNGVTIAVSAMKKGCKVAILTDQYHHGNIEWANNLCLLLNIPLFDNQYDLNTPKNERGKKKWREAIEVLKKCPNIIFNLSPKKKTREDSKV